MIDLSLLILNYIIIIYIYDPVWRNGPVNELSIIAAEFAFDAHTKT